MIIFTLALLLATAGPALAGPAPSPAVVAKSTGSAQLPIGVSTQTVSSLYTGDRVRDPFLPAAMGGTSTRRVTDRDEKRPEKTETFDAH